MFFILFIFIVISNSFLWGQYSGTEWIFNWNFGKAENKINLKSKRNKTTVTVAPPIMTRAIHYLQSTPLRGLGSPSKNEFSQSCSSSWLDCSPTSLSLINSSCSCWDPVGSELPLLRRTAFRQHRPAYLHRSISGSQSSRWVRTAMTKKEQNIGTAPMTKSGS